MCVCVSFHDLAHLVCQFLAFFSAGGHSAGSPSAGGPSAANSPGFLFKKVEYLSKISLEGGPPAGGPLAGSPSAANDTGFLLKKV